MKLTSSGAILAVAASAVAYDHGPSYGGSGPYPSYYFQVESLAGHTFYQPIQSASGTDGLRLPVLIWGNGACEPLGLKYRGFLGEVASHGSLVIATGPVFYNPQDFVDRPGSETGAHPEDLTAAIDWVQANAGTGKFAHVDKARIAVAGHSCGGGETYTAAAHDDRVAALGIFNAGGGADVANITKPVFYFLGGPTDESYTPGTNDYDGLPDSTPAWKGNHAKGHSPGFDDLNGGVVAVAATNMVAWLLRGDAAAKTWFTADGWNTTGFVDAVYQSLDGLDVTPI